MEADKIINKTLIELKISKENWKENYTFRAKIGIRILQIVQVLSIKWIN